jgi:peroxiredoxin
VAQRSEKVKRYVADNQVPVDLLIDDSRNVLTSYGVWRPDAPGGASVVRPALFLIDRAAVIRYTFVAQQQHEYPGFEEVAGAIRDVGRGAWDVGR